MWPRTAASTASSRSGDGAVEVRRAARPAGRTARRGYSSSIARRCSAANQQLAAAVAHDGRAAGRRARASHEAQRRQRTRRRTRAARRGRAAASCSSSASRGAGPRLVAHALDRLGVERAEVARLSGSVRRSVTARVRRSSSGASSRKVYGLRVQDLVRERRRLGRVARVQADLAALDALEHAVQAVDVHRLVQAVVDGLADQRVVGDLDAGR